MKIDTVHNKSCRSMGEVLNGSINIRNEKGQFVKGIRYSLETEFKKEQHWRKPKSFWNKDWLNNEYHNKKKSAAQIAGENNCTENNILFWLKKHNIQTRTMTTVRKMKYWGLWGKQNGMYGKNGKENPNWNGGYSPERQSAYARSAWKELAKKILKRDNYACKDCSIGHVNGHKLIVHHIKEWSRFPELRFEPSNLITLCQDCHKKRHLRR